MKRSPLKPGKPLKRQSLLKRTRSSLRRVRLQAVGRRARREAADLEAFRQAVWARGKCEVCGKKGHAPLRSKMDLEWASVTRSWPRGMTLFAHHVTPRSRAPREWVHDAEKNGLALCRACHSWVHEHPEEARRKGWLR